ncbi:two-pore potassium channel 3-like [Prunus yedoensis var. nudiflora]|uniref:Two-pore potassium channel 3-like n=1 Tax=Prunus yedoensis var. nudiflora TaxID=2094558 RepID=A0A314UI42_PRUYE|nr:two-pore potassium channel 3-like [Prunus yedoensis var. nudiflora]
MEGGEISPVEIDTRLGVGGEDQQEPSRGRTPRSSFPSSAYLDVGPSRRLSTAQLLAGGDVIVPIITTPNSSSYANLIANLNKNKRRKLKHRSHSAPSLLSDVRAVPKSTPFIVRQAFIGVIVYVIIGIVIFCTTGASFKGQETYKPVDALYFIVVTLCTIGYGDIVPETTLTKLFTCFFILVGFGFIDILLNGLVAYICDRQESVLLSTMDETKFNNMIQTYMIDREKGRMRIRIKVGLALSVVIGCIAIGTIAVHFLEDMSWINSFYLSVTSVTTVGYGDFAFKTVGGRCFAIVWLLVSTLAVARAFLYLTELRIDKRNRRIAKWVLQKEVTMRDLIAADLNNDGCISMISSMERLKHDTELAPAINGSKV